MSEETPTNPTEEEHVHNPLHYIVQYKTYNRFDGEPVPWYPPKSPLEHFAVARHSNRSASETVLTKDDVFRMLRFSVGRQSEESEKRCYPSAGARYPLEIYILVYEVEGLENGAYHYSVLNHELTRLWDAPAKQTLHEDWGANEPDLNHAKVVVFMAALTERTTMKYGELGEYFPLIECGYVGSMIHQYSSQIGAHFCPMGAQWSEGVFRSYFDLHEEEPILHAVVLF